MKAGLKLVLVLVIASITLLSLATEVTSCIPGGAGCGIGAPPGPPNFPTQNCCNRYFCDPKTWTCNPV